jgi:homogentisate phytyltransferase/homogentisate geranylgeranyltransferase
VLAVLVQFGFFFHMREMVRKAGMDALETNTNGLFFATAFMFVFSIVIALFKDIPDVRGDRMNKMNTLSVRLGTKKVFWTCIGLLQVAYASSIAYSLTYLQGWLCLGSVALHGLVATLIALRALRTDLSSPDTLYGCYMDVWKAFYFEYLLIPLFLR